MVSLSLRILILLLALPSCFPSSKFKDKSGGAGDPDPTAMVINSILSVPTSGQSGNPRPFIRGSVSNSVASLTLYKRNGSNHCAIVIGTGSAADFRGAGIQLTSDVAAGTTTQVFAKLRNSAGTQTDCVDTYFSYIRLSASNNSITLLPTGGIMPASPATSLTPTLTGTVSDPTLVELAFYSNSGCTTSIRTVNIAVSDFEAIGAQITVPANAITQIYAKGFDEDGAGGSCQNIASYHHDNVLPNPPTSIQHLSVILRTTNPQASWPAAVDQGSGARSGILRYDVSLSTAAGVTVAPWQSTTALSHTFTGLTLAEGTTYLVHVRAVDRAGNVSAPPMASSGFRALTSPPSLTIASPANNAVVTRNQVSVTGSCIAPNPITYSAGGTDTQVSCNLGDTFAITANISGDAGEKSFQLTQSNGLQNATVSLTLNYQPLSPLGLSIGSGNQHSCATHNGRLYCWGYGASGALGNNNGATMLTPQLLPLMGSDSTFEQITAGRDHSCVLRADRSAHCAGLNNYRQAAPIGNIANVYTHVRLANGVALKFLQISAGAQHTCGVDELKRVFCWGRNDSLQVGAPSGSYISTPSYVNLGTNVYAQQVSAGGQFSCALTQGNLPTVKPRVLCWGRNTYNELGRGISGTPMAQLPAEVHANGLGGTEYYTQVSSGYQHSCAVTNLGRVLCWGANTNGALGSNGTLSLNVPTLITMPAGVSFTKVAAGGESTRAHSCALTTQNRIYCWGSNNLGQIGNNLINTNGILPTAISLPSGATAHPNYTEISLGGQHSCAKSDGNQLYCWGSSADGRLGVGTNTSDSGFQRVPKLVTFP